MHCSMAGLGDYVYDEFKGKPDQKGSKSIEITVGPGPHNGPGPS